jgi:hypothetical protein
MPLLRWTISALLLTVPILQATAQTNGFTFTTVADTATAIPGGSGNFEGFGNPSISGTTVAFYGQRGTGLSSERGVFVGPPSGGPLGVVADQNAIQPDFAVGRSTLR